MQSKPQRLHSSSPFIVQPFVQIVKFWIWFPCLTRLLGIEFTASAMDIVSVDFLHSINVPFIKVTNQHNYNDNKELRIK